MLSTKDCIVSFGWKSYMYFFASYFKSLLLISSSYFLILYLSFFIAIFFIFFGIQFIIAPDFLVLGFLKLQLVFFRFSSVAFICLSSALLIGKYLNLASSIILLWPDGKIFSPIRYSYLSIFQDDKANIFAVSLLISHWFSYLILSLIVMINFSSLSEKIIKNYLMQE